MSTLITEAHIIAELLPKGMSRNILSIHYSSSMLREDGNPVWEIQIAGEEIPTLVEMGAQKSNTAWGEEYRLKLSQHVTIIACIIKEKEYAVPQ